MMRSEGDPPHLPMNGSKAMVGPEVYPSPPDNTLGDSKKIPRCIFQQHNSVKLNPLEEPEEAGILTKSSRSPLRVRGDQPQGGALSMAHDNHAIGKP
ncbi:hypothetical protein GW17_00000567 [Ensete ventricosum]|nr:hypothetical protein GW17_00000567 [Ensete ventricosum]